MDEESGLDLADWPAMPRVVAHLLWTRGVRSTDAVRQYLLPSLDQLHDPMQMCGMREAVERILRAVRLREPVLIYGDYDVDGTLATVLLKTAIDRITPRDMDSLVRYHIPHRIREGYGVQASVLGQAAVSGVRLVVSVDTGIRAFAAADEAKALGLDLIVTDHHLPETHGVPHAVAVVNPNQAGCGYPEKNLCGASVAYKLAEALLRDASHNAAGLHAVEPDSLEKLRYSLLKLAAIATVADAVPLTGENRTITALGLGEMRQMRQPGLRALMRLAQVGGDGRPPRAEEIAFRVAPRINAAGRMDIAGDVVRLLLTRDSVEAETLAEKLHRLNDERRNVEATVLVEIQRQLEAMAGVDGTEEPGIYVLDGDGWHRGVIGILASRVVERTNRPAVVICHEEGTAYGSGRSVEEFHLLDAITAANEQHRAEIGQDLFHRFGGHAHAVGFSLASDQVNALRKLLTQDAAARRKDFAVRPALRIDAELPLERADRNLWEWLCRMQPFGNGNAEPVFLASGLRVLELKPIKERHLKLRCETATGTVVECLAWARSFGWPERAAERGIVAGTDVDVAYQLRWSEHPEFGGVEVHVCDLRRASGE